MGTRSQGREEFAAAKYGPDSEKAKIKIVLGDVVTSIIRTHAGQTVVVTHDTSTPRPQSGDYMMQGTKGLVQDSQIYLKGKSPPYQWENFLEKYAAEYEHPLWRDLKEKAKGSGHGGMDFIQAYRLIYCLRNGLDMDIDVYDGAATCAISELSEQSIAGKSKTMDYPDFTRGKWKKRKPIGIVESGFEKTRNSWATPSPSSARFFHQIPRPHSVWHGRGTNRLSNRSGGNTSLAREGSRFL